MKKIVYVFDNKEYNHNQRVTLKFIVEISQIENFLKQIGKHNFFVEPKIYEQKKYYKHILVTRFADNMYNLFVGLGCNDYSEIRNNILIDRHIFRNESLQNKRTERKKNSPFFNKFKCYNSTTKETKYINNTPFVIKKIAKQGTKIYSRI